MSSAPLGIEGDSPYTVMIVATPSSSSTGALWSWGDINGLGAGAMLWSVADGRSELTHGSTDVWQGDAAIPRDTGRQLITLVRDGEPTQEVNGAEVGLTKISDSGEAPNFQPGALYVGTSSNSSGLTMTAFELAIWKRALSVSERQDAACAMHSRWSLELPFGC